MLIDSEGCATKVSVNLNIEDITMSALKIVASISPVLN